MVAIERMLPILNEVIEQMDYAGLPESSESKARLSHDLLALVKLIRPKAIAREEIDDG